MIEKIRLGKTDMMVTRVGFGGIPIQRLNEEEAVSVVKRCLELGVNFLDTANGYTTSEERIGKAIAGRREGLILATKSLSRSREGVAKHLQQSLKQLGVDSVDLYQFHSVSDTKSLDAVLDPNGPMSVVQAARKAGKIKHIGITSHQIDVAKKAIESDQFETIMFPFNFVTDEAAKELLPLTREHDMGFIDMKPLAGGMISNARLAFKYLFGFPDVVTIPGIEKPGEIEEIIGILSGPHKLTAAEKKEMQALKKQLGTRFCHRCDYCQPCTEGIAISTVMIYPSLAARLPSNQLYTGFWATVMDKAAECSQCGDCEERCPYHLPIRDIIAEHYEQYERQKLQYHKSAAL